MSQDEIEVIKGKDNIDAIGELMDLMGLYVRINFYNNIHEYIKKKNIDDGGINGAGHLLMYYLYKTEKSASVRKLSQRLMINSISRVINTLEDAGYIERNFGKKDKRTILISLSEKGKAFMVDYYSQYDEAAREFMSEVYTDEQREYLKNMLIDLINFLKQAPETISKAERVNLELKKRPTDLDDEFRDEG